MKPHLRTRVPEVIDGLLTLLGDAPALDGIQVVDGPVKDITELDNDAIVVAPGTPDNPGTTVAYELERGLGRNAYTETIEVSIAVSSFSGDEAMKPRRDQVVVLLGALQEVLDANQTRDGAWDSIGMGAEAVWHQVQSPDGATCAVGFTVVARSVV